MTVAPAPRAVVEKGKKKKGTKNAFERELGVNGAKERERAKAEGAGGASPKKERKIVKGGSAGKAKGAAGSKRDGKAAKRS